MTNRDGMPDFQRISYTYNYTLAGYTTMEVTRANLGWSSNPSGYTPFCCSAFNTGNKSVELSRLDPTSTNYVFRLINWSSSSVSATVTLRIIFIKTEFLH